MHMIYKDDTLYVELIGDLEFIDIKKIKKRLFSVLEQYEVDNIVVNTRGLFNINKKVINSLKNDYYKQYHGNLTIKH